MAPKQRKTAAAALFSRQTYIIDVTLTEAEALLVVNRQTSFILFHSAQRCKMTEFYKLDLNGNELLKLISPFSSPNEPNFLQ
jgi:hypothetical protein